MVTYVLDSSAVLRYLDDEPGAARVSEILKGHIGGRCEAVICALHWGEVAGISLKLRGEQAVELVLSRLNAFGIQVIAADGERAVRAARIKVKRRIPYVDAFGVEFAAQSSDRIFVTSDFDFKPAAADAKIEFLPAK